MTIKRSAISEKKMKMLDIYISNPSCRAIEMSRLIDVDVHTVAKWKAEWEQKLLKVKINFEEQIAQTIEKKATIFQKATSTIQGLFK